MINIIKDGHRKKHQIGQKLSEVGEITGEDLGLGETVQTMCGYVSVLSKCPLQSPTLWPKMFGEEHPRKAVGSTSQRAKRSAGENLPEFFRLGVCQT